MTEKEVDSLINDDKIWPSQEQLTKSMIVRMANQPELKKEFDEFLNLQNLKQGGIEVDIGQTDGGIPYENMTDSQLKLMAIAEDEELPEGVFEWETDNA